MAIQDTATQLISAIRRVRRMVPRADPVPLSADDYDASGKLIAGRPRSQGCTVDGLVCDALPLLGALEDAVANPDASAALGLLAFVAGQDVEQHDDGTWKIPLRVAPDRIISTVDPEAQVPL